MNIPSNSPPLRDRLSPSRGTRRALLAWLILPSSHAHASLFKGEALDTMANVLSWAVLVIAPTVIIAVFWLVHILPEKIAEKRQHPQYKAIQCLCLLSLFFGGMLWPLAWLWAYSKPVLHKLAYGTDVAEDLEEHGKKQVKTAASEVEQLRAKVALLEQKLASSGSRERGEA